MKKKLKGQKPKFVNFVRMKKHILIYSLVPNILVETTFTNFIYFRDKLLYLNN